jgi:hypothetical protein
MKKMIAALDVTRSARRTVLLGGLVLLFMSMDGQSAAGQNVANNPTEQELIISEVSVNVKGLDAVLGSCAVGDEILTIRGENFDNGAAPAVMLGDQEELTVCAASATEIVARCPAGVCPGGDFLVSVITGPAVKDYDEYDLTIVGISRFEASCASGEALQFIDPDGNPAFACTDEFALDTELEAETSARVAKDNALMVKDSELETALSNETAARVAKDNALMAKDTELMTADSQLQSQITTLQSANKNCPAGEFLAEINLKGTPTLVCRPETIQSFTLDTFPQNGTSSCSCTPSCQTSRCCCRISSALGGGQDPLGCFNLGNFSFCTSDCGTQTEACTGTGSCTAPAQSATCPAGSQLTSCLKGSFGGGDSCDGVSGISASCSASLSASLSCNCSAGVLGCGTACTFTLTGGSQTQTALSSQAMCGRIL